MTHRSFFAEELIYLLRLELIMNKVSQQYKERSAWYRAYVQVSREKRPYSSGGGKKFGQRLV